MKVFKKLLAFVLEPKVFFLFVAFLLVQLWFSKGLLFGGTEAGVPTYTPEKIYKQIIWTWWEALGPGVSLPTVSASIPFVFFMTVLERIGFDALNIQKIIFFIVIYLQGLGASLVFKIISLKVNRLQLLAGLFYIFNPFMMINVWHRFIYANFFLSAALPFLVYFYFRLIDTLKLRYIFYFLLTSFLASYMYSSISQVIAIWLSIFILYIVAIILNRKNYKKVFQLTFLTILLLIFWVLTNLWWIYPLFNIKTVFSAFSSRGTVDTLNTLSEQSAINYVIRGINPYSLFFQEDWGVIYQNYLFQFLSWIPVLFILFSLIKRDIRRVWYMILLFVLSIFAAKGAAPPLGEVTAWIYANFFFLGAIRNPYEKLGLLVVLPASILITLGISNFWNLYKSILTKALVIILVAACGVYVWPMWSDKLFGSDKYPPFFTLPKDYKEVESFLSKELESDSGKVLHLPITEEDSATYKWNYSYNGVELASHLFPGSSISRFLYVSFVDQLLKNTAQIFHTTNYDLQKLILSNFGVKYIVLNRDLDWYSRGVDNPEYVERILDSSPNLKIIKQTENLKVYKLTQKTNPFGFSANNLTLLSGSIGSGSEMELIRSNFLKESGVFLQVNKRQQIPREILQREIIFPTKVFTDPLTSAKNLEAAIPHPYVKHLPGVFYYPLILAKEKVELFLSPPYDKPMRSILISQKRLIESKRLEEQHKESEFKKSVKRYADYLNQAINQIKVLPEEELGVEDKIFLKVMLWEQRETAEDLISRVKDQETKKILEQSKQEIIDLNKEKGFELYYSYDNESIPSNNKNIYQFIISEKTNAELIFTVSDPQFFNINVDKKISIFLDGKVKEIILKKKNNSNLFSLGNIELNPGIHEIALLVPDDTDLVQTKDFVNKNGVIDFAQGNDKFITMTTSKDNSYLEYSIPNYDPDQTYIVGFFYRVVRGVSPQIQFWQDADMLRDEFEPKLTRKLKDDSYDFDWKYIELSISSNNIASITLRRNTTKPIIRIFLPHWNNCEPMNRQRVRLCRNREFRKIYNKPSVVEIRDLKITKSFTGKLFLSSTFNNNLAPSQLEFRKVSPIEYSVDVINTTSPSYIILNETFHSGWRVTGDSLFSKIIDEKNHFLTNGYANGWLIDQPGKLALKIKFVPQQYLSKGIVISLIAYILVIILITGEYFLRKVKK